MTTQELHRAVDELIQQARRADELLPPEEAACVLNVKIGTLANWRCTKRADIPYIRIGKRAIRYRWGDLQAFIQKSQVIA